MLQRKGGVLGFDADGLFFCCFLFFFCLHSWLGWIALRVSGGGSILGGSREEMWKGSDAGKNVVVMKSLGERGREGKKGKESEKIKKKKGGGRETDDGGGGMAGGRIEGGGGRALRMPCGRSPSDGA